MDRTITFRPYDGLEVTCEVDWDADGEVGGVPPSNYTVTLDADALFDGGLVRRDAAGGYVTDCGAIEDSELLSDALSDRSGWCHRGYRLVGAAPAEKREA